MPDDKAVRCDCGYEVTARDETGLLEEIRLHARETHGMAFTVEDALVVVLQSQLDLFWAPAQRSVPDGRAQRGGSL